MNRYPYPYVGAARGGGGGGERGGGGGFMMSPRMPSSAPMMMMRPPPPPSHRPPAFHRGFRGGGGFWPWWGGGWWGGYWPWSYPYYQEDVCVSVRNAYLAWRQVLATGNLPAAASFKSALDGVLATSSCPARGAYFAWQQAEQAGIQPLAQNLRNLFESILYQGTNSYTPGSYPYYPMGSPFGFPYGGYPLGSMQVIQGLP